MNEKAYFSTVHLLDESGPPILDLMTNVPAVSAAQDCKTLREVPEYARICRETSYIEAEQHCDQHCIYDTFLFHDNDTIDNEFRISPGAHSYKNDSPFYSPERGTSLMITSNDLHHQILHSSCLPPKTDAAENLMCFRDEDLKLISAQKKSQSCNGMYVLHNRDHEHSIFDSDDLLFTPEVELDGGTAASSLDEIPKTVKLLTEAPHFYDKIPIDKLISYEPPVEARLPQLQSIGTVTLIMVPINSKQKATTKVEELPFNLSEILSKSPECSAKDLLLHNPRRAEAARRRYHEMTAEEKRSRNKKRAEWFRQRRKELEVLLSTPAASISLEEFNKAQEMIARNKKRSEMTKERYQKMTRDERKAYNRKRTLAKKARAKASVPPANRCDDKANDEGEEIFRALEENVMMRTEQAYMSLRRMSSDPNPTERTFDVDAIFPFSVEEYLAPTSTEISTNSNSPCYLEQSLDKVNSLDYASSTRSFHPENSVIIPSHIPDILESAPRFVDITSSMDLFEHVPQYFNASQNSLHNEGAVYSVNVPGGPGNGSYQILVSDLSKPTGIVLSSRMSANLHGGRQPVYSLDASPRQCWKQRNKQRSDNAISSRICDGILRSACTTASLIPSTNHLPVGYTQANALPCVSIKPNALTRLEQKLQAQTVDVKLEGNRQTERTVSCYLEMSVEKNEKHFVHGSRSQLHDFCDPELSELEDSIRLDYGRLCASARARSEENRKRRARRAETARLRYHRMSVEERKEINAAKEAKRRQKKREREWHNEYIHSSYLNSLEDNIASHAVYEEPDAHGWIEGEPYIGEFEMTKSQITPTKR